MNGNMAKEVENFQRAFAALEIELGARKQALLARLAELLHVPAAPEMGRLGRTPKGAAASPIYPAGGPHSGRKFKGEASMADLIVKVLRDANRPMNAREIVGDLQKLGWQTASAAPQTMVYKTLHRIEKEGAVTKAGERGKFVASNEYREI